jgi:hypothetical protein
MERDLSQLRNERDRYKQDWERSQQSLGLTTKKLTDTIMQMEELNTSSKVTTSVIKSSGMYSSKTIDPNYRGEAFGK